MTQDKFILQEKDLQLVVNEKTLGSLTTNAKQIKSMVEKALPNYDVANYNEDNIDLAKKDKAMLNNASKALNSKRIEIEKEFMKPFSEFKDIVSETIKLISSCSNQIDDVVKESEVKFKREKKELLINHFESLEFKIVDFEKIFDEKWLNKTSKEKNIFSEIESKIQKIRLDLKTLEAIGENVDLLKSMYLENLDLNETIIYSNNLKENSKKIAESNKKDSEVVNEDEDPFFQTEPVKLPEIEDVEVHEGVDINQIEVNVDKSESLDDEILVRTMKVKAPKSKIISLADFMNSNGIEFEKLS